MSRASEAAIKAYPPIKINCDGEIVQPGYDKHTRNIYQEGYKKAEENIISLIESRIGEILGDAQPAPVLRAELRELINKIKEK